MTYNLHPIFVHFPIALLLVYSVIKVLPFKKWFPKVAWRDLEVLLLFIGVTGAFLGLATGETAEHLVRPNRQLVEMHATFATLSTWLYVVLLLGEVARFVKINNHLNIKSWSLGYSTLDFIEKIFCNKTFSIVIALLALISLSITGLLGGVITYGVTADPFAPLVLSLLGITL